jgi:hypothetical protein
MGSVVIGHKANRVHMSASLFSLEAEATRHIVETARLTAPVKGSVRPNDAPAVRALRLSRIGAYFRPSMNLVMYWVCGKVYISQLSPSQVSAYFETLAEEGKVTPEPIELSRNFVKFEAPYETKRINEVTTRGLLRL